MTATERAQLYREIAAEMDTLAEEARSRCRCPIHLAFIKEYARLATSYRQRAIEALLAAPEGTPAPGADRG